MILIDKCLSRLNEIKSTYENHQNFSQGKYINSKLNIYANKYATRLSEKLSRALLEKNSIIYGSEEKLIRVYPIDFPIRKDIRNRDIIFESTVINKNR